MSTAEAGWKRTISDVNDGILVNTRRPHPAFYVALLCAFLCLVLGAVFWGIQITLGIGMAGLNSPVYWGVYITNFVFWVGIGHAGTLISAILFLFRAKWRNSVKSD